jgi:hypothetical protein
MIIPRRQRKSSQQLRLDRNLVGNVTICRNSIHCGTRSLGDDTLQLSVPEVRGHAIIDRIAGTDLPGSQQAVVRRPAEN